MLRRRRRTPIRIGLVGDEVPGDLGITCHGANLGREVGVRNLPRASRLVVVANPYQRLRSRRELVGCGFVTDIEQVPTVRRDSRRLGARIDHVAVLRGLSGYGWREPGIG